MVSWDGAAQASGVDRILLVILVVVNALLLELGLLVLDGDVRAGGALPLLADEVGDLLVLGLLDGGFVVLDTNVSMWCFASRRECRYLRALTHELLLDKVDT